MSAVAANASSIRDALRCGRQGCECGQPRGNVHCPVHDDKHPSFSVTDRDGKVLVHCHGSAGCTQDAIVEELRERDLWPRHTEPRIGSSRPFETRYAVRDSAGVLHATHVRRDLPNGGKQVWWDPRGVSTSSLPLYGTETLNGQSTAVLGEGEKIVEWMKRRLSNDHIGVVGSVTGAKGTPSDESLRPLLPYRVILWPDADPDGMAHMYRIGSRLLALGHNNVQIVLGLDAADLELPVQEILKRKVKTFDPAKFTIHGPYSNRETVKTSNLPSRLIRVWEEAEPPVRQWDVPALLPRDTLTLWYGDSGVYKSILATALATAKVSGGVFLGHRLTPGPVLYVDTEFSQSEFVRRSYQLARGMGMDRPPEGLHYYRTETSLSEAVEVIAGMVAHTDADLLITDSLTLGLWDADTKGVPEVATVLEALTTIGCTVLVLDHTAKPAPGSNMSEMRAYGTFAKQAKARHVVQVLRAEGGGVMLRPTKSNVGKLEPGAGAEVEFNGAAIHVQAVQVDSDALSGIEHHMPKAERVFLALSKHKDGTTPEALVEELDGIVLGTVRNHLTALKRQGRVKSNGGVWSVITDSRFHDQLVTVNRESGEGVDEYLRRADDGE